MSLLSSWRYNDAPTSAEDGTQRMEAYFRRIVTFLFVTQRSLLLRVFTYTGSYSDTAQHSTTGITNAEQNLFYKKRICNSQHISSFKER
jgi:hypothetical protein